MSPNIRLTGIKVHRVGVDNFKAVATARAGKKRRIVSATGKSGTEATEGLLEAATTAFLSPPG